MARASETSHGYGKRIDTIFYDVEQIADDDRIITRKVTIDLYMKKKFAGEGTSRETVSIWITASCEEQGAQRAGTDIDAVLKALRSDLDRRYRIKWERWLYVMINRTSLYRGEGEGLSLSWDHVERGVTLDGDLLMRRYRDHGDWSQRWEIMPWPDEFKDERGKTLALIPENDANIAALRTFAKKVAELRKALAEFVSPDNIESTLFAITSGATLKMIEGAD